MQQDNREPITRVEGFGLSVKPLEFAGLLNIIGGEGHIGIKNEELGIINETT
jgi:hypothetical protein